MLGGSNCTTFFQDNKNFLDRTIHEKKNSQIDGGLTFRAELALVSLSTTEPPFTTGAVGSTPNIFFEFGLGLDLLRTPLCHLREGRM